MPQAPAHLTGGVEHSSTRLARPPCVTDPTPVDPGSRQPRQNVVEGRFPKAGPAEPEAEPIPDAPVADEPLASTAQPGVRTPRRLASLAAEWGWLAYLACAVPAVVIAAMAAGGPLGAGTDAAVAATGIIALLAGLRLMRPRAPAAWYFIAAGMGLFVAGDVLSAEYERVFGMAERFPSAADAVYLAAYPLVGAGLALLIHARHPKRDRASLVDTLVFTIGAGAVSWIFLIGPFVHEDAFTQLARLTIAGRLLADIVLLGFAVRLVIGSRERSPSLYLLAASILVLQATDAVTVAMFHHGMYLGAASELGRMLFVVVAGAAALHPSLLDLGSPVSDGDASLSRRRLAALTAASLAAPSIVTIRSLAGDTLDIALLTLTFSVLFSLVVLRMGDLVRHHEDVRRGEDALRTAGEALVTAASRDHIHEAAMVAVRSLLGPDVPTCLYAYLEDRSEERRVGKECRL